MSKYLITLFSVLLIFACSSPKGWEKLNQIELEGISPIGLALENGQFWIADGDHNRVLLISQDGEIVKTHNQFDRPMHLAAANGKVYVPEYGADQITILEDTLRKTFPIPDSLDAPAGVDAFGNELALVDFYNHRMLYFNGKNWITIGKQGKGNSEFEYPTDVQITSDKLFVADAYNNRIQVFDKTGKHLNTIGEDDEMNAATGIFVSEDQIFVTDFENDRIMIYNLDGKWIESINEVNKPTDVLYDSGRLFVTLYQDHALGVYKKQ